MKDLTVRQRDQNKQRRKKEKNSVQKQREKDQHEHQAYLEKTICNKDTDKNTVSAVATIEKYKLTTSGS